MLLKDVNSWLANLYFKVGTRVAIAVLILQSTPMSRDIGERRENVVRLQYTSEVHRSERPSAHSASVARPFQYARDS